MGVTNPDSQLTNSSNSVGEGCVSPGLRKAHSRHQTHTVDARERVSGH